MTTPDNKPDNDRLQQAIRYLDSGDLTRAGKLAGDILAANPASPPALQLCGRIAASAGDSRAAIDYIRQALDHEPDNALFYYDLGIFQKMARRPDEAIASYRRAIELNPRFIEAMVNLGNLLKETGSIEEAIDCYRHVLGLHPGHARALENISIVLKQQGRTAELTELCQQLLASGSASAGVHFQLALTSQLQGNDVSAVRHYRQALAINPQLVTALHNLGAIYNLQGNLQQAAEYYRRALAQKPDYLASIINLGDVYENLNRLEEAGDLARRALELDPGNPAATRVLATLSRRHGQPETGYSLLSAIRIPDDPAVAQIIHMEFGKCCDQTGRYDEAFAHFTDGNRLLALAHQSTADSKTPYLQLIDRLRRTFTAPWVNSWTHINISDDIRPPVFLIGFPRSGTTLLDQILDSHPQVTVIEEKPVLAAIRERVEAMAGGYPDALAGLSDHDVAELRAGYMATARQYTDSGPGQLVVDKLPLNIIHTGLCQRIFPEAAYILALRHPCDACLSCFMQPFSHNMAMANFYTLEDSIHLYDRTMELWEQYRSLFSLRYHCCKYEQLIGNPAHEIARLLEFLDLPWDDSVLAFHHHAQQRKHINTPSYQQVTQPIYQTAKFRWKKYEKQIQPSLHVLDKWIAAFGYRDG